MVASRAPLVPATMSSVPQPDPPCQGHQEGSPARTAATSPLKQKGRGALMAAAAAEQRGILEAGGRVTEQFANWRSVKSRVRAGGRLANLAQQLQDGCPHGPRGSRKGDTGTDSGVSPVAQPSRTAGESAGSLRTAKSRQARSRASKKQVEGTARRLPSKYAQLEALFQKLEVVCSLLHSRKKTCTFEAVKKPLEDTTGRRFLMSHLAQLVHVYPEAFALQYVSTRRASDGHSGLGLLMGSQTPPKNKWDLRIDLQPILEDSQKADPGSEPVDGVEPALPPAEHSRRRLHGFRKRLMQTAAAHHARFLHAHGHPQQLDWHPDFDLDQVPDIPSASLPSPPRSGAPSPLRRRLAMDPAAAGASPDSELTREPGASFLSPGHAGSPFSSVKQRPPTAAPGTPTKRSLAAAFDSLANSPDAHVSSGSKRRREGLPTEGLGRSAVAGGSSFACPSGTRSHPQSIDSATTTSSEELSRSASGASSACVVLPLDGGSAGAGEVVLPAESGASVHGVPLHVLHQVAAQQRQREADSSEAAATQRRRRDMLRQLPGLVNTLRSLAESEGRCVLREAVLLERVLSTHPRLTDKGEVEEQLALLRQLAPDLLQQTAISTATLYRINLKADFDAVKRNLVKGV